MTTAHISWRYRGRRNQRQQREFCAEQSRRAQKRWAEVRDAMADEPARKTRVVLIEIRDSMMPMRTIRPEAEHREQGWIRWAAWENGRRVSRRRFGGRRLAKAIAESLG